MPHPTERLLLLSVPSCALCLNDRCAAGALRKPLLQGAAPRRGGGGPLEGRAAVVQQGGEERGDGVPSGGLRKRMFLWLCRLC